MVELGLHHRWKGCGNHRYDRCPSGACRAFHSSLRFRTPLNRSVADWSSANRHLIKHLCLQPRVQSQAAHHGPLPEFVRGPNLCVKRRPGLGLASLPLRETDKSPALLRVAPALTGVNQSALAIECNAATDSLDTRRFTRSETPELGP